MEMNYLKRFCQWYGSKINTKAWAVQVRKPQTVYDSLAAQVGAMQADLQDKVNGT
jgi:hypothetical protein